jgi:hypothetical protein
MLPPGKVVLAEDSQKQGGKLIRNSAALQYRGRVFLVYTSGARDA